MTRAPHRLVGLGLALALVARPAVGADLKDLYFGEALYHVYQGQYFDAIQRLDTELAQYHGLDEPQRDTLHYYINDAEFAVGDLELNYRMHQRAGRAVKAVLEGAVDESVRNEAAFRLARINFQKDQLDDAQNALGRIQGAVPVEIRDDVEFLRANIDMATGRPGEAVKVLQQVHSDESLAGFVAYNLGIALFQGGRAQEAIGQLDKAGRLPAGDSAGLAIRDKSNLVLGSMLFESGDFERAKQSLDRVRLEGPFSNQALLRAGWADASAQQYDRALVPWNILVEREPTDAAVQEAMLAVPHAYASLNLHGRAAILYGRALELFSKQIEKVDASIGSIREGRFLNALIREESRQDETWVVRLRSLPEAPETFYLMELMASHDFQTALHNYLDLEDLKGRLMAWKTSLDAFDDIIRLRGQNYEPLLPEGRAPAGDADRAAAGLSGDRGGADGRRAPCTHRKAARRLQESRVDRAAPARGPPARRPHVAAGNRVPRAADRGLCAPEGIECASRGSHPAVRRLRQDETGGDPQLCGLRRLHRAASPERRRIAAARRPSDGPAGKHDRGRSHRPAECPPGTPGGPADRGTLRRRR
ncbi:MAG: tetratricopeptide repeat protein [Candidatus Eisenbacteria bacterium]|uniref:Tetratricopeptide repeat protein n=1 Tax=Eiseniibacteriota bacterium TaxID=2212470 RepID=A0A538TJX4_UNCEI|nr:MAG: tetratricopeptide repeat protein [Candidatus Eisenbacteria bacterium]